MAGGWVGQPSSDECYQTTRLSRVPFVPRPVRKNPARLPLIRQLYSGAPGIGTQSYVTEREVSNSSRGDKTEEALEANGSTPVIKIPS